jgi:hypothetical protein
MNPKKLSSHGLKMMNTSMNNILYVSFISLVFYLMYRYMRSIENEMKELSTIVKSINKSNQKPPPSNVLNKDEMELMELMVNEEHKAPVCTVNSCNLVDEDTDSVQSEEIMDLIEDIEQEEENVHETKEENVLETNEEIVHEANEEIVQETDNAPYMIESDEEDVTIDDVTIDDDFVINKKQTFNSYKSEDLMKKTNDDLKRILKDQGKNTKGSKADLVKRIETEL